MSSTIVMEPRDAVVSLDNDDVLYEVIDGQRVEIEHMGAYAGGIASTLLGALIAFTRGRGLGRAVVEVLFALPGVSRQRRPDVAFVSYDRWPRSRRIPVDNAWPVAPDLAVEVISPTNTMEEVIQKIHEYFQAGVRLVWVILPEQEQVYVYQSPTQVHILTDRDDLDGGAVLPGFRLPISEMIEREEEGSEQDNGRSAGGATLPQ